MALDLGTKRCGVAVSDKTCFLSMPIGTISYNVDDYASLYKELNVIIKDKEITHVIMGEPKNMDGSSGFATRRSDELVSMLKGEVIIIFVDERLTSVYASKILRDNGKNAKQSKGVIDTVSACLILDSYLRSLKL